MNNQFKKLIRGLIGKKIEVGNPFGLKIKIGRIND